LKRARLRLDKLLVERGLAPSRPRAQALILAGKVLVDDTPVTKAGSQVAVDASIRLKQQDHPYVSRGGLKLAHALDRFGVDPTGRVCADLGASTGGFTDCLLQRGAKRVYAIDVGYGQLAWKLRQDERVVVMERTNARHLDGLPEPIEVVVGDLSFISLAKILPAVARIAPGARACLLVKPQFEVGRQAIGKAGLVKDPDARAAAVAEVLREAVALGFEALGEVESPITGAKSGNVEHLVDLRCPGGGDVAARATLPTPASDSGDGR